MPAITQRVEPAHLPDLSRRTADATLAYDTPDGPACVPVVVRHDEGRMRVSIDPTLQPSALPISAALLVDDGHHWWRLRAVRWRGTLFADDTAGDGPAAPLGFRPDRAVAWDYGTLREQPAS